MDDSTDIVVDILKRLVDSPLAICDLSARNPNVMYELGIRHAFDFPTVLMKDGKTDRTFDIASIRSVEYDESLRVDLQEAAVDNLVKAINATKASDRSSVNSLVSLLSVEPAKP